MTRYLLGIETSCDDTSVAIVSQEGEILSNIVSSQFKVHEAFQGVVPELASRAHLNNLPTVYEQAMKEAEMELGDLAGIAVTQGPGLIGCLMVGLNFAKTLAWSAKLPLLGVNHIKGHVAALFLEHGDVPLPALALIVSGGHTHLLKVGEDRSLTLLTKTRDDSAGEAYDKLSKMMGLGFPGGPTIDRLAREGNEKAYLFSQPKFRDGSEDYSFSGLKTAASRVLEKDPHAFADRESQNVKDLCASFQRALVKQLLDRVKLGLEAHECRSLLLGGGVACNSRLRADFGKLAKRSGVPAFITAPKLSTDNAAMIAAEGWRLFEQGERHGWEITADVRLRPYEAVDLL